MHHRQANSQSRTILDWSLWLCNQSGRRAFRGNPSKPTDLAHPLSGNTT
jgi:hypothetical protein